MNQSMKIKLSNPIPDPAGKAGINRNANGLRSGWRTLVATWSLVFGTSAVTQAVDFNDGGIHTISDATYQDQGINVSNGSTLIIEPGAILTRLTQVFDTSTLKVNGGFFRGDALYS